MAGSTPSPYSYPVSQPYGPSTDSAEPSYGGYLHFHQGVDYTAPLGTPVPAISGGTVIPNTLGEYGYGSNLVLVKNPTTGNIDLYGHMESSTVTPGQTVQPGQIIGAVGSEGNSSGPHLHIGLLSPTGKPLDPSGLLTSNKFATSPVQSQGQGTAQSSVSNIPVIGGILGFATNLFGDIVRVILGILAIISLFIGLYILFKPKDAPGIGDMAKTAVKLAPLAVV
jgi:murein DD-endopeptidase MepM/ murein hydrolase activator NlpD